MINYYLFQCLITVRPSPTLKSELKGSGVSDGDIDERVQKTRRVRQYNFVKARQRQTNCAGVEYFQTQSSGGGGYDAELKGARVIIGKITKAFIC